MDSWETILSVREFEDYTTRRIPVPEYDPEARPKYLALCEENLCGLYNTNWGCPPAFEIDAAELYRQSEFAILVRRTFCLDVKDRELVQASTTEMQKIVRMMVVSLRSNGVDCRGFADGGCRYCGVCALPDPCRFPDMLVPSISGLGLDMGRYMESVGERFSFSDDCMTLYGLIFVKKSV